jgi:hypothetical protein
MQDVRDGRWFQEEKQKEKGIVVFLAPKQCIRDL